MSVIEDYDVSSTDGYNPGNSYQRGLVSGHEFSHIYGEQYERDVNGCVNNCNIMDNGAIATKAYWWLDESETQIQQCFLWGNCT